MIRNETVSVTIGASQVYPLSVSITAGIGKGFNTCRLDGINLQGSVGDDVEVIINTIVHRFIVDSKNFGKKDSVNFECVGLPATLDDDSLSAIEYTYLDSNELIESSSGTITVVNNIPNILFSGQSYAKDSTSMSRILDMVNVIGGEAYEVNETLHLEPITSIPITPTIAHVISDSEVLDFSYSERRTNNVLVQEVLINPLTDDLFSEASTTLDYDDEMGRGEVYFNPSLSQNLPYKITGLNTREALQSVKTELISLSDVTSFNTMGGIDSIVHIRLDGEPMSVEDYVLYDAQNIVRFLTKKTGELEIRYNTKSITVYAYVTTLFNIKYQCSISEGELVVDADNINKGTCYTEIIDPLTYENGGNVLLTTNKDVSLIFIEEKGATNLVTHTTRALSGGGMLTIKYLYTTTDWVNKTFMSNITSSLKNTIETFSGEIIYDTELALHVIYLDKPLTNINAIFFGNVPIVGYTYVDSGSTPYITFDAGDVGKSVDISMNIEVVDILIPAPLEGHPVTILDAVSCSGLVSLQFTLDQFGMCNLPATFKIDVAGSFNKKIQDVFGLEVTGDLGTLIVDNFGEVSVTVSTQGVFIIDCSNITENGIITVDSTGVI